MDIPWDDVRLFLAVVEGGSLSGAARKLRIAQPTVSRRIAELEARLAEPLFSRGVEGTALTPFGEGLLEPARRMAESAAELERAAERVDARPHGTVRITAAPGVAYELVTPFAAWLRSELPAIRVELVSSLLYLDLVRREADLALRMQYTPQRDLVCLAEITTEVGAYASRGYAEKLKRGYGPADIDWIGWAPPLDHLAPNPQLAKAIPGFRPVFASDDFIVQYRAAEVGLGAIALGRYRHRFAKRELVELDIDLRPYSGQLYLLAARSALAIPRVRAVADLLAAEIRALETPKRRGASTRTQR
jgi:DNA-binding transcriptional LysR family regulator